MSFEVHTVQEPAWIKTLVDDVVLDSVQPLGFIGHLGYRFWEPGNKDNFFDGWMVAVYPTPNEVRGPTAHDGCRYVSGFSLDVRKILGSITNVDMLVWRAPVQYNGDLDGPEIGVRGQFAGKRIWLRFFSLPPPDEPSTFFVNPRTGEALGK